MESVILFIAAISMVPPASGLNFVPGRVVVPRTMISPMIQRHRGGRIHAGFRFPRPITLARLEMQGLGPAPSGGDVPPATMLGVSMRLLLRNWADEFTNNQLERPLPEIDRSGLESLFKIGGSPMLPPETPDNWHGNEMKVLQNMRDVIEAATSSDDRIESRLAEMNRARELGGGTLREMNGLEGVALLPDEVPYLEDRSTALGVSVLALGVFSRGKLKDDITGSLRRKLEEKLFPPDVERPGLGVFRSDNEVDVFAVEGLVHAPGFSESSARVLLAKIAKYAQSENKFVVMPQRAYVNSDGTYLTEYYEHLGFERVELMAQQDDDDDSTPFELVYTGASVSDTDMWLEKKQVMIGTNLWAQV